MNDSAMKESALQAPSNRSAVGKLETQRSYYNARWADQTYVAKAAVRRAGAMLTLLGRTGLKEPEILDFGSGAGWFASMLSMIGPTTAVELSDEAVRLAAERWPWIDFHAGDVFTANLPEGRFDVVVSQEVLEHVEDQAGYAARAARLLKAGGFLILTTPNEHVFRRLTPEVRRRWEDQPIEKRLLRGELMALLRPHFEVVEVGSTTLQYPRKGVYRLINGRAIRRALRVSGLERCWEAFWLSRGFGMHLHVLARRK